MDKKIKDLTEQEILNICSKNNSDCSYCPLGLINGCEIICLKQLLNKKIKITDEN